MRDPEKYHEAGRNDPTSPQQREEHPYDFVRLPPKPIEGPLTPHGQLLGDRLHGALQLVYLAETPLHVGSGTFDTTSDRGFPGAVRPIRGLVRRQGRPVLPGSSWKGVVRSRFEAFTHSRLAVASVFHSEAGSKLPGELKQLLRQPVHRARLEITDPRVQKSRGVRSRDRNPLISLADAVFGCMGYRGRVRPMEGEIEGPAAADFLPVPALDTPQPHRLAQPGAIQVDRGKLEISAVEGRKFYYDGPLRQKTENGAWEPIDQVPAGSILRTEVFFDNLLPAELGALLLASGYGEKVGIVRFGGYKSAGLGKVVLQNVDVQRRDPGRARRSWRSPTPVSIDPGPLVEAALEASWFDAEALAELDTVTRRQRPAPGGTRP